MPVDMSGAIYAEYERTLLRARRLFEAEQPADAAEGYRQAARLMNQYAAYAVAPRIRAERLRKAKAHLDVAEKIAAGKLTARATEPVTGGGDDYEGTVAALIYRSAVTWNDIGGLEETKRQIKQAYGLSMARKPVGMRMRGWQRILLYGPPGTGKTLLAAAASNGLDATFFNMQVSDLLSKYFGESTKLISSLFALAREHAPSVIFMDEIESLTPLRGEGESGSERRILNTFMTELGGLEQKDDDRFVLTIAATNAPWLMDNAILSRFEQRIYVPLPDEPARRAILRLHLVDQGYETGVKPEKLAAATAGYSGREIGRLCSEAINHMVDACNPDLGAIVDQGREAVEAYEIQVRPLTQQDFDDALDRVRPETTPAQIKRFEEWQDGLM
jgi:katanin p60 ATPase-containing subunit A1